MTWPFHLPAAAVKEAAQAMKQEIDKKILSVVIPRGTFVFINAAPVVLVKDTEVEAPIANLLHAGLI